jgi:hypothetical protein
MDQKQSNLSDWVRQARFFGHILVQGRVCGFFVLKIT